CSARAPSCPRASKPARMLPLTPRLRMAMPPTMPSSVAMQAPAIPSVVAMRRGAAFPALMSGGAVLGLRRVFGKIRRQRLTHVGGRLVAESHRCVADRRAGLARLRHRIAIELALHQIDDPAGHLVGIIPPFAPLLDDLAFTFLIEAAPFGP